MMVLRTVSKQIKKFWAKHVAAGPAAHDSSTIEGFINLVDDFIDGSSKHPYAWDDFISEKSQNPTIEEIRKRINGFEHLLFTDSSSAKTEYKNHVIQERNKLAAIIGRPARNSLDA